jgi:transcriptional regulator with XRE-family HTH domain
LAARIRAAFAYADIKRPAAAAALGVSVETVSRWTSGSGGPPIREVREQIAGLTGVPLDFLEHGFRDPEPATESDELRQLRQDLADLQRRLPRPGELEATVEAIVAAQLAEAAATAGALEPPDRESSAGPAQAS